MSTDRSTDPSPFAWVFGLALSAIAVAAVARAVLGGRPGRQVAAGGDDVDDDGERPD